MPGFAVFETTESVIEILWDIALAFFIVRLAIVYFALAFSAGVLFSYLTYARLLPLSHATATQSTLLMIPLQLLVTLLCARFIIVYYEIPRVGGFRLAIGGLAMVFMLCAELLVALFLREEGYAKGIDEMDLKQIMLYAGSLLVYALMPTVLMTFERKVSIIEETAVPQEKREKSQVAE
jgi:hypothetical protein